jgi:flagellar protein FlgJ
MQNAALPLPAFPAAAPPVAAPNIRPAGPQSAEGARKSAEDFAAFFYSQTLETMFSGLGNDALFGGGNAETVFRSLMLQEYGKVVARSGGLGITDAVQREIIHLQEAK